MSCCGILGLVSCLELDRNVILPTPSTLTLSKIHRSAVLHTYITYPSDQDPQNTSSVKSEERSLLRGEPLALLLIFT